MTNVTANDLLSTDGELFHKKRTALDLIRHLKTREEKSSANYSLLLGAGASVTSGIRAANTLVDEWAVELHERFTNKKNDNAPDALAYFEKNHPQWFNPSHPYSSLFEKKFDLPAQRRRFVEQEVDKKLPSIGYAYLASLVDNGYINNIFTTNFDDLINEAFYLFSIERPILCAHDSSIHSISITSKRPKIIKLHGDYLFDDIKSTLRETESLEHNTKEKFVEFGKEFGLIVVGYSGNDRSIMDVIEFLVKQENYLKNGVYWCLRSDDKICHALRNLLWKDKVYPVIIDGFDEFLAECHENLIESDLNLTTNTKNSKLQKTIQKITEDPYKISKNPIIKKEIDNIQKHNNSQDISDFIRNLSEDSTDKSKLEVSDLRNLLEIQFLSKENELDKAYELCEELYYSCKSEDAKPRYIQSLINLSDTMGDQAKTIKWCDKLLSTDENNINYIINKSRHIKNMQEKSSFLEKQIETHKYSTTLINYTARAHKRIYNSTNDNEELNLAISLFKKSLLIEPSLDNIAWSELLQCFIDTKSEITNSTNRTDADDLVKKARTQNPEHIQTLEIAQKNAAERKDLNETKGLIKLLYELHDSSSKSKREEINLILSRLLYDTGKYTEQATLRNELERFYDTHIDIDSCEYPEILLNACKYQIAVQNDIQKAKNTLRKAIIAQGIEEHMERAIVLTSFIDKAILPEIEKILNKSKSSIYTEYYYSFKSDINIINENYDEAEQNLLKAYHEGLEIETFLTALSYLRLLKHDYGGVISILDRYKPDFSHEKNETLQININFAAKKIKSSKYNETLVRNLSAQSKSDEIKICAFKILGQDQDARRLIKKNIEKDHLNYHYYSRWPIIEKDFLDRSLPDDMVCVA